MARRGIHGTQISQKELPLGTPTLMMGFTQDGQVDEQMVSERDKRLGISSADKRQKRSDTGYPPIDPDVDAWQRGVVIQLEANRKAPEKTASATFRAPNTALGKRQF